MRFGGMISGVQGGEEVGPRATYVAGGRLGCTLGAPSAGLSLGRVARQQSPPPFHPAGGR